MENRGGDSPGRKSEREQHEAELDGENCGEQEKDGDTRYLEINSK